MQLYRSVNTIYIVIQKVLDTLNGTLFSIGVLDTETKRAYQPVRGYVWPTGVPTAGVQYRISSS